MLKDNKQRLGQRIVNDILEHVIINIQIDGKTQISISCPSMFYMTDKEFRKKYLDDLK